jgi:hypothetical protein
MAAKHAPLDDPQLVRLYRLLSEILESDVAEDDPRLEKAADIMAGLAEQAYTASELNPGDLAHDGSSTSSSKRTCCRNPPQVGTRSTISSASTPLAPRPGRRPRPTSGRPLPGCWATIDVPRRSSWMSPTRMSVSANRLSRRPVFPSRTCRTRSGKRAE